MIIGSHQTHPAADSFPLMEEPLLNALAEDIKTYGLMRPIVLLDDLILDGRNRYLACIKAGVEPRFRIYDGETDSRSIAMYVMRENMMRRDLDPVRRAFCMRRLVKTIRERKLRPLVQAALPLEANHVADVVIADGVPELVAAVENGEIPADLAVEVAKHEPEEQRAMLERLGRAEPQESKPKVDVCRSAALDLSPLDIAAVRALVHAGEASVHGIVKAGAALLRKMVPGV